MRIWLWLVVAGCWRDPVTPADPSPAARPHVTNIAPRSDFDDLLVRFESVVDEMCDCHDHACADHVADSLTTWANEMTKARDIKPTDAELDRMSALSQRYAECVNAAMGAP